MRWFSQGDKNTLSFFHSYVKGKRRKWYLHEIHNKQGEVLRGNANIRNEVVVFFHQQFQEEGHNQNFDILESIPRLFSDEENEIMVKLPEE